MFFVCLFFGLLSLFRAAPAAYGSSQARGLIGAAAAGLATATAMPDLGHVCDLCQSSRQCQILYLLSKAIDRHPSGC